MPRILNINLDNLTLRDFLAELKEGFVVTPNADHLIKLQKDKRFYEIYQNADYVVCDSTIVWWSSIFLGTPIVEKISGSDFFPAFCNFHKENKDIRIFLLGAAEGVAQQAALNINEKIGRKIIVDYRSPSFGFEKNKQECVDIVEHINASNATVLAVGVGTPKQEKWIAKYKEQLPKIKIFLAIGATIDFEAGHKKRAPIWISKAGLEWMYRLLLEPKRLWKRYIVNDMPFLWLIIKQKLELYKNPFTDSR